MIVFKDELRRQLTQARRALSPQVKRRYDDAISAHLNAEITPEMRVAAYMPLPSEPLTTDFITSLPCEVLLPICGDDGLLTWSLFDGTFRPGPFGIREPAGPLVDDPALAACDLIIVPALAVRRDGIRLGKGAGYYDRALAEVPEVPTTAVVYSSEVRDDLPAEPHDIPVTSVVTEQGTFSTSV